MTDTPLEYGAHLTQASTTIEQLTPQAGGDDLERVARAIEQEIPKLPDDGAITRTNQLTFDELRQLAQAAIVALCHRPDTRAVEVLRPFAEVADDACFAQHPDSYAPRPSRGKPNLAHYRAARTLLSELEGK